MENKFRKGLILGGLLATAAAVGFAMSDEGHHLSAEAQKDLKHLARRLKKNLHRLEDVTKEKFDTAVTTVVEEYAEKKELAVDAKNALISALQAKWHDMTGEYHAEKEEEKTKK